MPSSGAAFSPTTCALGVADLAHRERERERERGREGERERERGREIARERAHTHQTRQARNPQREKCNTKPRSFLSVGGHLVVEATPSDLARNPRALRKASEVTGVKVVMGCGGHPRPNHNLRALDPAQKELGHQTRNQTPDPETCLIVGLASRAHDSFESVELNRQNVHHARSHALDVTLFQVQGTVLGIATHRMLMARLKNPSPPRLREKSWGEFSIRTLIIGRCLDPQPSNPNPPPPTPNSKPELDDDNRSVPCTFLQLGGCAVG